MKRTVLIAFALILCISGIASAKNSNMEINKGTFLIGGASSSGLLLGDHTLKPEGGDNVDVSSTAFTVMAHGGYFVVNKLAVGPILGIGYGKAEVDQKASDTTSTMSSWDIGIQGTYIYPLKKSDSWAPFGALAIEYLSGNVENEVETAGVKNKTKNDISGWSFTPRGGVMIFMNKRFAIDLSVFVKYISGSGSTETGGVSSDLDVTSMNYGLMIGLNGFLK